MRAICIKQSAVLFVVQILLMLTSFMMAAENAPSINGGSAPATGRGQLQTNAKREIVVGIVQDHNDVLHYWGEAVKQGLIKRDSGGAPLVHVDSHSDASLPEVPQSFYSINHWHNFDTKIVRNLTDIGNFIPVGQYMGIVAKDVLWIRPDWQEQHFNFFDSSVKHKWIVTRRKPSLIEKGESFLCLAKHKDSPDPTRVDSLPAVVRKPAQCFDKEQYDSRFAREIEWFIQTISMAKENITQAIPADEPYILDIDEDYFATMDPVLEELVPANQFGPYFDELERLASPERFCFSNDAKMKEYQETLVQSLLKEVFWGGLTLLSDTGVPFIAERLLHTDESNVPEDIPDLWCDGREAGLEAIVALSKLSRLLLSKLTSRRSTMLLVDYDFPSFRCKVNTLYGVCFGGDISRPFIPRQEIDTRMDELRELLSTKLNGSPVVVTIARSPEYTATGMQPYIETRLLQMLQRFLGDKFDLKVDYFADLKPINETEVDSAVEQLLFRNETVKEELLRQLQSEWNLQTWFNIERPTFDVISEVNMIKTFMEQQETDTLQLFGNYRASGYKEWKLQLDGDRKQEIERLLLHNTELFRRHFYDRPDDEDTTFD